MAILFRQDKTPEMKMRGLIGKGRSSLSSQTTILWSAVALKVTFIG